MYDPTWFIRGAQSALFYYVSCAPCSKYSAKRKRQKQNERDRRARETFEAQSPELYRQPSPYRTNEYWSEEISLGPGPPPKRANKKQRNARSGVPQLGGAESPAPSGDDSKVEVSKLETVKQKIHEAGERWNSRRYQREDEELWGVSHSSSRQSSRQGQVRPGSVEGSSIGLPGVASQHETARSSRESFYTAKNPPLNDLHPPVVSNPGPNWQSNRWMLQPPPPASVMAGYEQANRSRSNSATSTRRGGDVSLSRQVGEKILERKLQNGQSIPSIGSLRKPGQESRESQNHDWNSGPRSRSASYWTSEPSSEESNQTSDTVIHRHPPSETTMSQETADNSIEDNDFALKDPSGQRNGHATDLESYKIEPNFVMPRPPKKALLKPQPVSTNDSSLQMLQELVSPAVLLNSRVVSGPTAEANMKPPPSDSQDDLKVAGGVNDGGLPSISTWADEYHMWDRPERRMRWSY